MRAKHTTCQGVRGCIEQNKNTSATKTSNPAWSTQWHKLASSGDHYGVTCDEDGPSIGPVRLLVRTEAGLIPRRAEELNFIFGRVFGRPTDFAAKMNGLWVIARALEASDLPKAMIATQLIRLPVLPDEGAFRRAVTADTLAKAGFNSAQPRDERGRWTADGSSNAIDDSSGGFNPTHLIPVQEAVIRPFIPPWLEQIPQARPFPPTPPFPGDILPPLTDTPGNAVPRDLTNPFPRDPECEKEWEKARAFCDDLQRKGKIGGPRSGIAPSYEMCLRGQISERCGGNPVDWGRHGPPRSRYDIMASA